MESSECRGLKRGKLVSKDCQGTMAQHVHKYRRVDIGREKPYFVMQCGLDGCQHYVPMRTKLSCPVLKGKISICNKCGDRFQLDRRALRQAQPTCISCVVSPKKAKIASAMDFLNDLAKKEGLGDI
jgi:hypothetical protein